MISFIIMTLLEKKKICRTFRAVGHLGTLHTVVSSFHARAEIKLLKQLYTELPIAP